MAASPAPSALFAIATDNSGLHLYDSVGEMRANRGLTFGGHRVPAEFFDLEGHRLAPVHGADWRLEGLAPTADPPNPDLVLARLRAALASVACAIGARAGQLEAAGLSTEEALGRIPDLTNRTLAQAHVECHFSFGHPRINVGETWHMIFVHGVW